MPELLHEPADYGRDIFSMRTTALRDLLLGLPPPIGLKGLVASYSDATKLCFRLHLTSVNGRVALKDVLVALLQARLTASTAAGHEPQSASTTLKRPTLALPLPKQAASTGDTAAHDFAKPGGRVSAWGR